MRDLITVNTLIKWNFDDNSSITERILWIDENRYAAYVIDIYTGSGMPKIKKLSDIESALENNTASLLKSDPLLSAIPEENIGDRDKELRDRMWDILSPLLNTKREPDIYLRGIRGVLVKDIVDEHKMCTATIYKHLRRYWQRGKNKNALLPDYVNCGGKGKEKNSGGKKRGRPRKVIEEVGMNVDESTKSIFETAVRRFYHTAKENTFTTAYELMLKEFYTVSQVTKDGTQKEVLLPEAQIPTIGQFKYWYQKEHNLKKKLQSRKGLNKYELNHRAILGRSDHGVMGPGAQYQIDATVGDVYLVSRHNRSWIIGRPIIYFVIDVFTRMVAGLYVGLEGPSWLGAMMALANATANKITFCKEYGINILEEEWPCHHLPESILADRGELEGRMIETFINSFNVRIDNNPPYRADLKGIVEQYFRTINIKVKPMLPGFVQPDFQQRCGHDYRLDAKLDIHQLTKIIIKCVLYHNNTHWLSNYVRDEMMIADGIEPVPTQLWKWGIVNRSGRLRTFPEDIVKLNLMPSRNATVTARGIKFKHLYYFSETALKEMWFENARNKGSFKVDIAYDPRNMSKIYLKDSSGRSYEEGFLFDWEEKYFNKSIDEINYLFAVENLNKQRKASEMLQSKTDLNTEIENIVDEAKEMSNNNTNEQSKASRLAGIRENRKNEKVENRKEEAFSLGKELEQSTDKILANNQNNEDQTTIDLIEKKLEERLGGHK